MYTIRNGQIDRITKQQFYKQYSYAEKRSKTKM